MMNGSGMGNMSTLEQKVDVLLRFCMAQSDVEKNACYSALQQLQQQKEKIPMDVNKEIEKVLRELGIQDQLVGYAYLRTAVRFSLEEQQPIRMFTTVLYPHIAKVHSTVPAAVERGIRHAIEKGWLSCDYKTQEKYFGNQIDHNRAKPTNTQFVVRVANAVRSKISQLQN